MVCVCVSVFVCECSCARVRVCMCARERDVLLLFNPLYQSTAIGARHDGTNASHYFALYDFVSHLPDKFRALSTEILVWWGGRQMGRHGKG
jgi:hypothetical protein